MSNKLRRVLCLTLSMLLLSLNLAGCSKTPDPSKSENSKSTKKNILSKGKTKQDKELEEFTKQLFQTEIAGNTLNLHYTLTDPESYGITGYTVTLGDYSKDAELKAATAAENYKQALQSFDYDALSKENQLTYDIISYSLDLELAYGDYNLLMEPLSPTIGTQVQLPVLLAEYTFYKKEDIANYIIMLNQIPAYYQSILDFEQRKSKAGLFMADFVVDDIVAQCSSFIENPKSNYLIELFDEKIDAFEGLTEEETAALKEENKIAILNSVIPAYQLLIDGLCTLKGTGINDKGLCYYEDGKAYYELLVKDNTGSSRSIGDIQTMIDNQMMQDSLQMSDALTTDPSLLNGLDNVAISFDSPEAILKDLTDKTLSDFPEPPEVSCEIKYVPSSLEAHLSPAFYLVPPLDRIDENVIYINNANGYEGIDLYTTLAHEGYPGHLFQSIYYASTEPDHVRSIFGFGGYVEGWATYVEMYAYDMSGVEENMARLLQANNSFILGLYACMDIGVHYNGWALEEVIQYSDSFGIKDAATAESIYKCIIEEPANYLKYYVGYLEFLDLKQNYSEEKGDTFDLKTFHRELLTIGPTPFDILKKYLNK